MVILSMRNWTLWKHFTSIRDSGMVPFWTYLTRTSPKYVVPELKLRGYQYQGIKYVSMKTYVISPGMVMSRPATTDILYIIGISPPNRSERI
jgi:hypothetical protein